MQLIKRTNYTPYLPKKKPHIKFQHARNVRYFFELEELLTCGIAHNFETGAVLLLTQDPHTAQGIYVHSNSREMGRNSPTDYQWYGRVNTVIVKEHGGSTEVILE